MQKQNENVTKLSGSEKTKANCGRIYSDISTIEPKDGEETMQRNNWHVIIHLMTGYKVSNFCNA